MTALELQEARSLLQVKEIKLHCNMAKCKFLCLRAKKAAYQFNCGNLGIRVISLFVCLSFPPRFWNLSITASSMGVPLPREGSLPCASPQRFCVWLEPAGTASRARAMQPLALQQEGSELGANLKLWAHIALRWDIRCGSCTEQVRAPAMILLGGLDVSFLFEQHLRASITPCSL